MVSLQWLLQEGNLASIEEQVLQYIFHDDTTIISYLFICLPNHNIIVNKPLYRYVSQVNHSSSIHILSLYTI